MDRLGTWLPRPPRHDAGLGLHRRVLSALLVPGLPTPYYRVRMQPTHNVERAISRPWHMSVSMRRMSCRAAVGQARPARDWGPALCRDNLGRTTSLGRAVGGTAEGEGALFFFSFLLNRASLRHRSRPSRCVLWALPRARRARLVPPGRALRGKTRQDKTR